MILPDTKIQGLRTIIDFPDIYAPGEMDEIKKEHYVHEKGKVRKRICSVCVLLPVALISLRWSTKTKLWTKLQ